MLEISSIEVKDYSLVIHAPLGQIEAFREHFKAGKYEITPYKEKRSLNANRYLWKLCCDISDKLNDGTTDVEVYRKAVKEIGIFKDFPDMLPSNADTLMAAWGKLGIGWISEVLDYEQDGEHQTVRCWYGTSVYNTKQMSRILNYLNEDARSIGVDTLEDLRMQNLLEEWDKNHDRNSK